MWLDHGFILRSNCHRLHSVKDTLNRTSEQNSNDISELKSFVGLTGAVNSFFNMITQNCQLTYVLVLFIIHYFIIHVS